MKKTFIKFLPFAAAVLLATSCGKDDNSDNNVANPNNGTEVVTPENGVKTVPFTVKVGTNGKISKIAYSGADGTGNVTPTFEASEVDKLTMIVTGEGVNTTLTLKDVDGTFSGEIAAGLATDFDLTATITIDGEAATSNTSLSDLMKNCGHIYSQSFKYGDVTSGNKIMLVDNKSYIEVSWINKGGQEVTISGEKYTLNSDGKIWIAVAAGSNIVSDDLGVSSTTTVAGDIYTISRTFVAVTSISISGGFESSESNPYVWGSETTNNKTLTATVLPAGATNKTVKWSSNATNVTVDENTGKITITAPNTNTTTQTVTITATAQDGSGVSATYTLYLANYVQIAGTKWYTYDSQTSVTWANRTQGAPSGSAVPSRSQFETLIKVSNTTVSGNNIISNNGSNAYITLTYGDYWMSTEYLNDYAVCLGFDSGGRGVFSLDKSNYCRVRLVRVQQNFTYPVFDQPIKTGQNN